MKAPVSVIAVLTFALSCGGGGSKGQGKPSVDVDTALSKDHVEAGEGVEVTCIVRDAQTGQDLQGQPSEFTVSPSEGLSVEGNIVTATIAGSYTVTCSAFGVSDETPATLTVEPSKPKKVVASVSPETVKAGAQADVTCTVTDSFGNVVSDVKTTVLAPDPVKVSDHKVSSEKAGHYEISCAVEGAEQVESVSAILVVAPGDPSTVEVFAEPSYKVYAIGDHVRIKYRILDSFQNEVEGVEAKILPPPPPAITAAGPNEFVFAQEGVYDFVVRLAPPWDSVSGSLTLICDESPPEVTILFPDRGQTFSGDPQVLVRGTVSDISGIGSVMVNGTDVEVKGDGSFEFPITSKHGLNVIVVTATDNFDHTAKVTRGYYYSTKYLSVSDETPLKDLIIPEATMVFAGQEALDDGVHDPNHPNDLATFVEVMLSSLDIPSLLSQLGPFSFTIPGIVSATLPVPGINPGLKGDLEVLVDVTEVTLGSPYVTLKARDGGLQTTVTFAPVTFGLKLTFILHTNIVAHNPLDGKDYAIPLLAPSTSTTSHLKIGKLTLTLSLDIEKQPGKPVSVKAEDVKATVSDIHLDPITGLVIDLGEVDIFGQKVDLGTYDLSSLVGGINDVLANYVLNPLLNFLTQPLLDLILPLVTGVVGDAIEEVIGLLAIEQTVEIPPILGGKPIPLDLKVAFSSLIFTSAGARLGLDIATHTKKGVERDPLGSIMRDGCIRTDPEPSLYEFPQEPSVQAAIRHDLANEALFMVWWSGAIAQTFDVSGLMGDGGDLPISNLQVTPDLLLPPILDDCSGSLHLQVGDAYLDLTFQLFNADQHLGVWLQADIAVTVVGQGSEFGIRLDKVEALEYEIFDIGGGMGDLLGMVEGLLPALLGQVEGQTFMLPVPPLEVGGLLPGLPPSATVQLQNLTASSEHGVFRVGGDLK